MQMQADILALLALFRGHVPDHETLAWTATLAANPDTWNQGRQLFAEIRGHNLMAIRSEDHPRECQYCFEEVCIQSLYNETQPDDPFDPCSPYWVIKNALSMAKALHLPAKDVVGIVVPET